MLKVLLIGHMIADFYLQSSKMEEYKKKSCKMLRAHSTIYLLILTVIDFVFLQAKVAIWATLVVSGMHFILELIEIKINNRYKDNKASFFMFLTVQILQLTTIIITYYMLRLSTKVNLVYGYCSNNYYFSQLLIYCLLFVALLNPLGVFIKKVFTFLFKEEPYNDIGNNVGSTIGKLERIIVAILIICDQFSVIGFVVTAKSIARYKQLEEKDFAERYLIGTLLSLSASLILTIIFKKYFAI